jgi:hypothetical protein
MISIGYILSRRPLGSFLALRLMWPVPPPLWVAGVKAGAFDVALPLGRASDGGAVAEVTIHRCRVVWSPRAAGEASFGVGPSFTPCPLARERPSLGGPGSARARASAIPPRTVSIKRPCAAHVFAKRSEAGALSGDRREGSIALDLQNLQRALAKSSAVAPTTLV